MGKNMIKVMTPKFRVSFPSVFKPKAAVEGAKEKYSIVMLFPKSADLTGLKDLVKRTIREKYPDGKLPKNSDGSKFLMPFKDGDEKDYDGYKSTIVVTASSQFAPGVIDEQRTPILDEKEFYAGCYAMATVTAYCWSYMGKHGVSLGLQNIMKVRDGEKLGGGASAEDDFAEIELPENSDASFDFGENEEGDLVSFLG